MDYTEFVLQGFAVAGVVFTFLFVFMCVRDICLASENERKSLKRIADTLVHINDAFDHLDVQLYFQRADQTKQLKIIADTLSSRLHFTTVLDPDPQVDPDDVSAIAVTEELQDKIFKTHLEE